MHIAYFEPQRMEERRVLFIPPLSLRFFAVKFSNYPKNQLYSIPIRYLRSQSFHYVD